MMSQVPFGQHVEAIAKQLPAGAQEDFRSLMGGIISQVQHVTPGQNWIRPGGVQAGSAAAPAGVTIAVTGANGGIAVAITNPGGQGNQNIWHEVSYSTLKSFTQSVTTLPPTQGTSVSLSLPGTSYFYRLRSSFDLQSWSGYQLASTAAISAGLVSSAATSAGGAFNQTNFGVVSSRAVGGSAQVDVHGPSAPLTGLVTKKGNQQVVVPAATVIGATPGSDLFVGWTGKSYILRSTLADLLDDDVTPIGKVSVVNTGVPTLPLITPVIQGGYVVGFSVTNGGAGLTGQVTLTFGSVGGGVGATFGAQTISGGVLIAIAPGNAGNGFYSGGTTVTATGGGVGSGTPGGGTAAGGNGGRLTAV